MVTQGENTKHEVEITMQGENAPHEVKMAHTM